MNSEPRELTISAEHIKSAVELHLKSLRLIDQDDSVQFVSESSVLDQYYITIKKEAIN